MARPKYERRAGNALREQLRAEQGNRCHWCGDEMEDAAWGYPRPPKSVTLDHVTERCFGGGLTRENCVAACYACNQERALVSGAVYWRMKKLVHRITKRLPAAEIVERLGAVSREIQR